MHRQARREAGFVRKIENDQGGKGEDRVAERGGTKEGNAQAR